MWSVTGKGRGWCVEGKGGGAVGGLVCREGGVCVVMPCHCPLTIPSLLPPLCRSLVLATQGAM